MAMQESLHLTNLKIEYQDSRFLYTTNRGDQNIPKSRDIKS